jgi:hypothetical protein
MAVSILAALGAAVLVIAIAGGALYALGME